MITDRLLITDDDAGGGAAQVDLVHEVMIDAWPRLAGWIQESRVDEQRRRRLEDAAGSWIERGRGTGGLLDEIELAEAEAWRKTDHARELGESAEVAALIAASSAEHDRRAREQRSRRHLAVGAVAGVIVLLVIIAVTALSVARVQEQELQRDARQTNAYAAHGLAGAVAFHLREQVDAVVAIASDPGIVRLLGRAGSEELERWRIGTPFDSLSLYDRAGATIANVSAVPSRNIGKDFSWRDYFLGARRLGEAGLRAGYISRVFRSESDGFHKFGISAPVYDADRWVGVLLVTIGTDFALRRQRLDQASEAGQMAVVVAPRDRSRGSTSGAGDHVVLLHQGLARGATVVIDSPRLHELHVTPTGHDQLRWMDPEPVTDDAHRDPVPGFEGRWLAGFAPVGETGFVVIVQTRYDAAIGPNARLSRRLASRTGAVLLIWLVVCGAILFWGHARRAPRALTNRDVTTAARAPSG